MKNTSCISQTINLTRVKTLCYCFLIFLFSAVIANTASALSWGPFRGVTASLKLSEQDVAYLASTGANLIRLMANRDQLMSNRPPYEIVGENVAKMDKIISLCEKYGIRVVIDPHTFPGTAKDSTMKADDEFWQSFEWHKHAIRLWAFLAEHYKNYGSVIAGYDLLNEPAVPWNAERNSPADLNLLYKQIIDAIRKFDPGRPIILETPISRRTNRLEGIRLLAAPPDPYLVYSPHIYLPHALTGQGIKGKPKGVTYPGYAEGKYWDKTALKKLLLPVIEFQKKYNVPIYMGEFGATIWGGESADRYVSDLIDIFEELGWSWTYHAFRQAPVFDAEITAANPGVRQTSTPRLEILKAAFKKNKK